MKGRNFVYNLLVANVKNVYHFITFLLYVVIREVLFISVVLFKKQRDLIISADLFTYSKQSSTYNAASIEVLEGLEPVRKRPGMYIGGTDERAMYHLVSEVLDNSMDEAVAGYASRIELTFNEDLSVSISDNGRGIPVDPHPKFPEKSALEVILCTLHAGGKFSGKNYETSGGLHGVGISVVNALSEKLEVKVIRDHKVFNQNFSRGIPTTALTQSGSTKRKNGTTIRFKPDDLIFGQAAAFKAEKLFNMVRSKAYLFSGVELVWKCLIKVLDIPQTATFHFPGGLADYLSETLNGIELYSTSPFYGKIKFSEKFSDDTIGSVEWAINWTPERDGFVSSYCNTIPTAEGGTHETGFWNAILKGLKSFGEYVGNKKIAQVIKEDIISGGCALISVFIRDPEFVGQTKDRLATTEVTRLVELTIKDHFENWLASDTKTANLLLDLVISKSDDRLKRRAEKETQRKSAVKKLRLPGKLTDCTSSSRERTELFLVEGDSAGGSAKQARNRETQAILPLRGKILNVLGASSSKMSQNQEIMDLCQALGVGLNAKFNIDDLRYEKIIIMTDADVDGAHIAALLMTFFYTQMKPLIEYGRLFLAVPPLFKISQGGKSFYAINEEEKDALLKTYKPNVTVDVSRFKGLGEMNPQQLKETTMDPKIRKLIKVTVDIDKTGETSDLIERLMGKSPEMRFQYITQNAKFVEELDI